MSLHKELFKDNWAMLSPRNHNVVNRKLQQANRAEKRKNLYHQSRNIPASPKFDDFQVKAAASSTPMPKNSSQHIKTRMGKENYNKTVSRYASHAEKGLISTSLKPTVQKLNEEEKKTRHEAYIQRFIEWKAEKIKRKELEQKLKQNSKPPFIAVGKAKETTAPAAVPQKSFAPKDHVFHAPAGLKDPTLEEVKRHSVYLPVLTPPKLKAIKETKHLKAQKFNSKNEKNTLKQKKINSAIENINTNKQEQIGIGTTKNVLNSAPDRDAQIPTIDNQNNNMQENQLLNCNAYPSSSTKQPAKAVAKTKLVTHPKKEIEPIKPTLKTAGTLKTVARKNAVKQPVIDKVPTANTAGAIGKARAMHQKKENQIKQVTMENERIHTKPGLVKNLKAKKAVAVHKSINRKLSTLSGNVVPNKVPSEADNCQISTDFVTSTQLKTSTSALSNLKFSKISKNISPIETTQPVASSKSQQCVSAKRALLEEEIEREKEKVNKPRKFNFLRQIQLDETIVDSPITTMINNKEKAIPRKSSDMNKKLDLSLATKESKIQSKTQKNQEDKVVSRILQRIKTQFNMKPTTLQSPKNNKSTPRRSLKLEASHVQKKTAEKSKFNFLVEVGLDETAVESDLVEKLPEQDVEKNPGTPVKSIYIPQEDTSKEAANLEERPINYMSPFVSVSRGKVSARKENEKRNSIYLQETPTKSATVVTAVETPIEKRRALEAVRYFRQQLQDETQRLHVLCDQWNAYKEDHLELLQANNGEDMINVTIGQTRLLTSKKFMQFNGLINRCEAHANGTAPTDDGSESTKTITPIDLEGFWSMLGLQVENIGKRFENLERWKENDWEDPDDVKLLKPRTKNNLTKVQKAKTTMAATNGIKKPRANSALREMMRKKMAEMRANREEDTCTALETPDVQISNNDLTITCSPRRSRRSTQHTSNNILRNSFSNTPGRICIVVPDRKSRSWARTVISVPSPVRFSPINSTSSTSSTQSELKNLQNTSEENLLKVAVLRHKRQSRQSLQIQTVEKTPSPAKNGLLVSPNTPKNVAMTQNGRKSILKTPGTARSQTRNIKFNDHLSVRKFRALKYDDDRQSTEYDPIQQVHVDEFAKMKLQVNTSPLETDDNDNEDGRVYRLRNRKIKLRPSCEIELPK